MEIKRVLIRTSDCRDRNEKAGQTADDGELVVESRMIEIATRRPVGRPAMAVVAGIARAASGRPGSRDGTDID